MPINPLYVFIFFAVACLIKLVQRQGEHAFSRFAIAVWYFYLWQNPFISIATQQMVGRFFIFFLAFIEVSAFVFRSWQKRQYDNASRRK